MNLHKSIFALLLALSGSGFANPLRADDAKGDGDADFLREAVSGGMLEVRLGHLAAQQAESMAVRKFGERMITDHNQANKELMAIAEKKGIAIPKQLTSKHQMTFDKLKEMKGSEFDRAYMKCMVKDHEEDVAEFAKHAKEAKDEQVKAFAAKTLPTLKEHLQLARDAAEKVGGLDKR